MYAFKTAGKGKRSVDSRRCLPKAWRTVRRQQLSKVLGRPIKNIENHIKNFFSTV